MLFLIVDTSGKQGSVALAQTGVSSSENQTKFGATAGASGSEIAIIGAEPLTGGTFSAELVPQVAALIAKQGKTKNDLAAFVVVSGPGSFTGLRVGLAAIKGLAEALQKPVVALSLLEAIATIATQSGRILAALDAGRGDIYAGDYSVEAASPPHVTSKLLCHGERLLSFEEIIREANGKPAKRVVTADAGLAERFRTANLACRTINYPTSASLARLGFDRLLRGETVSADALEANYIRRSDAEIFAKPAKRL
jgi:tRNA threonylcarbamoyladenosine biosynthesis protein TsaB